MKHASFKSSTTRWVHLLYIASITFACQLSALEFDVETIPVKPKHRVDILSFSNRASGDAKLLIIETPVISQLEKRMQGLSNEPLDILRFFSVRARNGISF